MPPITSHFRSEDHSHNKGCTVHKLAGQQMEVADSQANRASCQYFSQGTQGNPCVAPGQTKCKRGVRLGRVLSRHPAAGNLQVLSSASTGHSTSYDAVAQWAVGFASSFNPVGCRHTYGYAYPVYLQC